MKVPKNYYSEMLRQDFIKYEEVRKSGKYNMVMDMNKVLAKYGISFNNYIYILSNYSELSNKYLKNGSKLPRKDGSNNGL